MSLPIPREMTQDLATVLQSLEEGVTVLDGPTRRILFVNEAAARMSGHPSPEASLAQSTQQHRENFQTFDEQGRPLALNELPTVRALAGEHPPPMDVRYRLAFTGEERWSRLIAIPLRDAQGGVRQVISVARDTTHQRRSERALRFLAEAGAILAASLDYRDTLQSVVRLAVPELADGCAVDLVEDDGTIHRSSAHVDPTRDELMQEIRRRFPLRLDTLMGPGHVIRTGEPSLSGELPEAKLRAAATNEEHLRMIQALGYRSTLAVPLKARGRTLGALSLVLIDRKRPFDEQDISLAKELATRAALAIDNARLYREAQAALERSRANEERLELALEAGRLGFFDMDLRTGRIITSPLTDTLFGYSPGPHPRTLQEGYALIHPEDRERIAQQVERLVRGSGTRDVIQYRVLRPDGSLRWVEGHNAIIRDEVGQPLRRLGVMEDVTERLDAEERSRRLASEQAARAEAEAAQARTVAILDSISEPLFALDRQGRYRFMNRRAEELIHRKREELIGLDAREVLSAPRLRGLFESLEQALREGTTVEREFQGESETWYELRACPFDEGVSVYVRDITARKRAQEAQLRLARYEALRADVSTALSGQGTLRELLQRCAEAMVRHVGVTLARIWILASPPWFLELQASAGRSSRLDGPYARIPVGEQRLGPLAQGKQPVLTNDLVHDFQLGPEELARREGLVALAGYPLRVGEQLIGLMALFSTQPLPEELVPALSPIADALSQGLERRRAEEALATHASELARSNSELEQFAYVASHDLQEPLRMVASYTQLLARRYKGRLDADADEFIGYAVDAVGRMKRLIDDLLTYSRVGTPGKPRVPIRLDPVIRRAFGNLAAAAKECGAQLSATALPEVLGDEVQLEQLFQNLVSNALKFRAPDVQPRIHVSAERRGREWVLCVRDNGIGIEPQYFQRIFVIFQRLHGKGEYSGTGIGLAVCKKIVERHGGRIWVESTPGQGSAFLFTLPASDALT